MVYPVTIVIEKCSLKKEWMQKSWDLRGYERKADSCLKCSCTQLVLFKRVHHSTGEDCGVHFWLNAVMCLRFINEAPGHAVGLVLSAHFWPLVDKPCQNNPGTDSPFCPATAKLIRLSFRDSGFCSQSNPLIQWRHLSPGGNDGCFFHASLHSLLLRATLRFTDKLPVWQFSLKLSELQMKVTPLSLNPRASSFTHKPVRAQAR